MRLISLRMQALSRAATVLAFAVSADRWITAAHAEDGAQEPAQSAAAAAPQTWTGFYIGGHGSFGQMLKPHIKGLDVDGAAGGIHAGWNYQKGGSIIGVEVDYSFSKIEDSDVRFVQLSSGPFEIDRTTSIDYLTSIRARFGGLITDDLLIFGTLGYALAQRTASVYAPDIDYGISHSVRFSGVVAGGGLEYRFSPLVSGRVEGLRYFLSQPDSYREVGIGEIRVGLTLHLPSN
jgi:opacity protein-like surface antigen